MRVSFVTQVPVRTRRDNVEARISDSGSSATLSPWRSGESLLTGLTIHSVFLTGC